MQWVLTVLFFALCPLCVCREMDRIVKDRKMSELKAAVARHGPDVAGNDSSTVITLCPSTPLCLPHALCLLSR